MVKPSPLLQQSRGSAVTMTCEVKVPDDLDEGDRPVIGWLRDGGGVPSSATVFNNILNQKMKSRMYINSLSSSDSGSYVCRAFYANIGMAVSEPAELSVPGIISAPSQVWVTTGPGAEVKFQCRGIVSSVYDVITYDESGWSGTLASYYNGNKLGITSSSDGAATVLSTTLSEVESNVDGLSITCYIKSSATSTLLDWHSTTFYAIGYPAFNVKI